MKDFEKILNEDIPSPEVQDERISYGSIDAIRLQGINALWATDDKSVLSAMVRTMKDLLLSYQSTSATKRICFEKYAGQFTSEAIVSNLLDFEEHLNTGKSCGVDLDEYVSNLQREFPWLTD